MSFAALKRAWYDVAAGKGWAVLLRGEAGIGVAPAHRSARSGGTPVPR